MTPSNQSIAGLAALNGLASGDRQTGRTAKQMIDAPRRSIFVWCNTSLWYPRELARYLGRTDLRIVSHDGLTPNELCGLRARGGLLVIDHAVPWSHRLHEAYAWARQAGVLPA